MIKPQAVQPSTAIHARMATFIATLDTSRNSFHVHKTLLALPTEKWYPYHINRVLELRYRFIIKMLSHPGFKSLAISALNDELEDYCLLKKRLIEALYA